MESMGLQHLLINYRTLLEGGSVLDVSGPILHCSEHFVWCLAPCVDLCALCCRIANPDCRQLLRPTLISEGPTQLMRELLPNTRLVANEVDPWRASGGIASLVSIAATEGRQQSSISQLKLYIAISWEYLYLFIAFLKESGAGCETHYPFPIHTRPLHRQGVYTLGWSSPIYLDGSACLVRIVH